MGTIKNARSYVSIMSAIILSIIITVIFLVFCQLLTKGERYYSSAYNGLADNGHLLTKVTYNKNPTTLGLNRDKMMDARDFETKEMKDAEDLETKKKKDAVDLEPKEIKSDILKQKNLNTDIHNIPPRISMTALFPGKIQEPIIIVAPEPVYPDTAKKDGIEGKIVLRFVVDERGFVHKPKVIDTEPYGVFEESALSAITKFRFIPAKRNNIPIESIVYLPIKYKINESAYLIQSHEMSYTFQ